MSESLRCFSFLLANAPAWIKQVEQLELRTRERKDEISRVPVPVSQHKVRKTGSTESIRPGKNMEENYSGEASSEGHRIEVTSAPQQNDLPGAKNGRQFLVNVQRKRKTSSVLSNYTTPVKYRSRSMIIVYYDSIVQEIFNTLVQNISTGRNHLRKAKMAARMEAFTHKVSESGNDDCKDPYLKTRQIPYAISSLPTVPHFSSARGFSPPPDALAFANCKPSPSRNGTPNDATLYDPLTAADTALETAQSYCEKGAHQFLREGDCLQETSGAKAAFHDVLILARQQTERLKEEEKEIHEQRRRDREARERHLKTMASGTIPLAASGAVQGIALHGEGPIEADDGESDEELENPDLAVMLPPYRLMART